MSDLAALPADLPLFEGVPVEKVPHVLSCLNATLATFSKRERILGRGETQRSTGYLCEGRAQLVSNDYWGNRSILGEYAAGSVLAAEQFFKLNLPLPADVVASSPCTLLQFNLERHVEAKPCCMVHVNRIRENLARITLQMNADLLGKLGIVSNRSTREKVLAYLSDQAALHGSSAFDIPYTRQELADALYVERSALSHELAASRKTATSPSPASISSSTACRSRLPRPRSCLRPGRCGGFGTAPGAVPGKGNA
ncbi:MAG: Crp/Fnr family transcriptional regulator [Gordonibacter pamelaeae]